ncbi:MAG: hypothetical protein ACLGIR_00320 [Actinomycetes bacterium]
MRRVLASLSSAALVAGLLAAAPPADDAPVLAAPSTRAGVAVVDATWNVGAAAGQYAAFRDPSAPLTGGEVDPHAHATLKRASYGVQSRLTIRAIVVEDAEGDAVALVKSDNYLAQDLLLRRVGQHLEAAGSRIADDDILHAASHNHSSPYYATAAAGVWLFQDVIDLRMFEYQARRMAQAILEAEASMVPVRVGGTKVTHDVYKGNIMRQQRADDGSPTGYPSDHGDLDLSVLRFDALDGAGGWTPLATWMTWGQHPESLDSHDLVTADFLAPLERMVERDTGAPLLFSQGDVGSAEGPYDGWNRGRLEDGTLVAWAHIGHAHTERGARLLADSVVEGFEEIGRGEGLVPWDLDADVDAVDGWIAGPLSHPYPAVSNCNTRTTAQGNPGAPVVGLPDCGRAGFPMTGNPVYDNLAAHGIVPATYDAPSFMAVEENARIRLQAVRIGDVLLASCACEAQVDLIENVESRTNRIVGDQYDGFDWATDEETTCEQQADTSWRCVYTSERARASRTWTFSDAAHRRWQAQVHNPADGWDDLTNLPFANGEPADPARIKGNFSSEELDERTGYGMVVGIGHAGDYNGYTVSYREFVAYDHYRKALTAYGPHTADWMSTWLVRMARDMNDDGYSWQEAYAALDRDPTAVAREAADEARQEALAVALGNAAGAAYDAYEAALADDVGPARAIGLSDTAVERFDAVEFSWIGGSNAVDNPLVRVERLADDDAWVPFADMTGEVQTMVDLPNGVQGIAATWTGTQQWRWTANFEAYTAGPDPRLPSTPAGTYRFVVDGHIRQDGATEPYALTSEPFTVAPWRGIVPPDGPEAFAQGEGADLLLTVPDVVVYPRSYGSTFPFVADDGKGQVDADGTYLDERVCETCTFRPWAPFGRVASVTVEVRPVGGLGPARQVEAERVGPSTWRVRGAALGPSATVRVPVGGIVDTGGNTNGTAGCPVVLGAGGTIAPEQLSMACR